MTLAPALLETYPSLSAAQREIVGRVDGPLLVIAGPGSGKTFSLVLRTLNLLLLDRAQPNEIVLCTFTEKAAFELRDRLTAAARATGYGGDLGMLRVGTIHGICRRILEDHRHRTPLGSGYEVLDELTQLLFLYEHFESIVGPEADTEVAQGYVGRWRSKWTAIEGLRPYLDKMTEELIDPARLLESDDGFLVKLGGVYARYHDLLLGRNRLDFAHLQRLAHDLLYDADIGPRVVAGIKYVMVDEYQDTNFIQEQIVIRLASATGHICVVGDEDQSLYRFRGATVRNILEFPARVPGCHVVQLTTNYRSHPSIVEGYDRWMASADWANPAGRAFRYDKTISPDPRATPGEYPAVFAIWGRDEKDEAQRFAEMVAFLKQSGIITDFNQVALLLHSVRSEHSGHYLEALATRGIPAFCPRARSYFENEEVRLIVACYALLLGYHGDGRGELRGAALAELARYVDSGLMELGRRYGGGHPLAEVLRELVGEIAGLVAGAALDRRPADYLYLLMGQLPFRDLVRDENRARNLAIFSQLLNTFQNYYGYSVITHANRVGLRFHFFSSFLRLLHDGGINEYEDPDQPFPKGHVQVMTIHQAKGLEFPVVVVGSLDKQIASAKQVDRDLQPFSPRPRFEPEDRITAFDRMRLHYVAFSRPEKILVLTTHAEPKAHFSPIWQGLAQWPYVEKDLLAGQRFVARERQAVKRSYSFTGDLRVYETCPRQYQYFREYDFTPSRSAVIFFGLLVHQAIEEIHRRVIDGQWAELTDERVRELFDRTFAFLSLGDVRPIGPVAREAAFAQVLNYFHQNTEEMRRVIETEVDVSIEKDGYRLTGKVDLLMGGDGRLELLDFKTSERPTEDPALLEAYERQLCTYAHILEKRHGRRVERLLLYWTAEPDKGNALMELPYRTERVTEAGEAFDDLVRKIEDRDFEVVRVPGAKVCKECDLRPICVSDGILAEPSRGRGRRRR